MEVCNTCGSKGYSSLLIHCVKCQFVAAHRYCTDAKPRYSTKKFKWTCEDCLPNIINHPIPPRTSQRLRSVIHLKNLRKNARQKKPSSSKNGDKKYNWFEHEVEDECNVNNIDLLFQRGRLKSTQNTKGGCTLNLDFSDEETCIVKGVVYSAYKKRRVGYGKSKKYVCELENRDDEEEAKSVVIDDMYDGKCNLKVHFQKKRKLILQMDDGDDDKGEESDVKLFVDDDRSLSGISESESLKLKRMMSFELDSIIGIEEDDSNDGDLLDEMKQHCNDNEDEGMNVTFGNVLVESSFVAPQVGFDPIMPVVLSIWRGTCSIYNNGGHISLGVEAHLPKIVSPMVEGVARALPSKINFDVEAKHQAWPKSFETSPPTMEDIGLFFLPLHERDEISYRRLLDEMGSQNLVLRSKINNVELSIFSSRELPQSYWRFQRKYYLWGAFRPIEGFISI